jgi:hypothetical protein
VAVVGVDQDGVAVQQALGGAAGDGEEVARLGRLS